MAKPGLLVTLVLGLSLLSGACHSNSVAEDGGAGSPLDAGPQWACLDQPSEVTSSSPVAITFTLYNAFSPLVTAGATGGSDFTVVSCTPVPGFALEGCSTINPSCPMPATPFATTDDAGEATVTVPNDFQGFFRLAGPGYLPAGVYMNQLLADASTFTPPIPAIGPQEAALIASALNVPFDLDGGVGVVVFEVYDCFDRHAAGVSFAMSINAGPPTVQYYVADNIPSTTAKQTDALGIGGALNVPAGPMTVTGTLVGTQRTLGSVQTVVLAGGVTLAFWRVRAH